MSTSKSKLTKTVTRLDRDLSEIDDISELPSRPDVEEEHYSEVSYYDEEEESADKVSPLRTPEEEDVVIGLSKVQTLDQIRAAVTGMKNSLVDNPSSALMSGVTIQAKGDVLKYHSEQY